MMNKRIKRRWVTSLRSKRFCQTRIGVMREVDDNGNAYYCPLGILCELHRRSFGGTWTDSGTKYLKSSAALPKQVQKWAGLECRDPWIRDKRISQINDWTPKRLPTIATMIDKAL